MLPSSLGEPSPLPVALRVELAKLRRDADLLIRQGQRRRARLALAAHVSRLLVREARRPAEQRGFRMLELSLAVDALFPELREVHDQEVSREGRRRQVVRTGPVLTGPGARQQGA
jgi:hypothetical protein